MSDRYINNRIITPQRTDIVTRESLEIVSVEEVKTYLRAARNNYDDGFIAQAIKSVTALCEREGRYWAANGTFMAYFNQFGNRLNLHYWPIVSVDSVEYQDVYGNWRNVAEFTENQDNYTVITVHGCMTNVRGFRVGYTGGNDTAQQVRDEIKTSILNEIALYYRNRGGDDTEVVLSGNLTVQSKNLLSALRR